MKRVTLNSFHLELTHKELDHLSVFTTDEADFPPVNLMENIREPIWRFNLSDSKFAVLVVSFCFLFLVTLLCFVGVPQSNLQAIVEISKSFFH